MKKSTSVMRMKFYSKNHSKSATTFYNNLKHPPRKRRLLARINSHHRTYEVAKKQLNQCNLLVAEDNQFCKILMQIILDNNEISYDVASNGIEALEFVQKKIYDIILMDIQMPEMDGIQAMRIIREKLGRETPIIAVTANAIIEELNDYLNQGFTDYITKPFKEEALINKLLEYV